MKNVAKPSKHFFCSFNALETHSDFIVSFRNNPEDRQIMNILRQRTTDIEVKKYCVSLLEKTGSFKYTLDVLEELDSKVRSEIEKLGGNVHLIALMDELNNWKK